MFVCVCGIYIYIYESGVLFVSRTELPNPCPILYLSPCTGHQLPKPDVILQLEKGEEPWLVERGTHRETHPGEDQSRGVAGHGPEEHEGLDSLGIVVTGSHF